MLTLASGWWKVLSASARNAGSGEGAFSFGDVARSKGAPVSPRRCGKGKASVGQRSGVGIRVGLRAGRRVGKAAIAPSTVGWPARGQPSLLFEGLGAMRECADRSRAIGDIHVVWVQGRAKSQRWDLPGSRRMAGILWPPSSSLTAIVTGAATPSSSALPCPLRPPNGPLAGPARLVILGSTATRKPAQHWWLGIWEVENLPCGLGKSDIGNSFNWIRQ